MHLTSYNYEWIYWQLYHKVTFDGPNRLILVNEGVTELNIRTDVYSAWKEWVNILGSTDHLENPGFPQAMSVVGGEPIPTGQLGSTFFLENGWKIKPYPGNYRLIITGNLFAVDGSDPFIPADVILTEPNNITINLNTSNLVDLINAQFGELQSTLLDELHRIHGLNPETPLVVDQTSRTAGAGISQTITKGPGPEGEEPVTVTRDP